MRLFCVFVAVFLFCVSAAAYTRIANSIGDMPKWPSMPVSYWINQQGSPQISNGSDFAAVQAAFQTWQSIPTADIRFNYQGTTTTGSVGYDGMNLVTFVDSSVPLGSTTIAATFSFYGTVVGSDGSFGYGTQESDIAFNTTFSFSTSGETGKYDIQSVLTHEIGHFLGLDHAAMVSSVMVPFAIPTQLDQRTLSYDDIAGVMEIYPKNLPATGKISGTVQYSGSTVFGVNVVAVDANGTAVVSTLSRPDGTYTLQFVPPGTYRLYAEPLDNPVTPQNLSAFYQNAQTGFGTTYSGNVATLGAARALTVTANATSTANFQMLPPSPTGLNFTRPAFGVRLGRGISGILTAGGYDLTAGVHFSASSPGIYLGTPSGTCSDSITTDCFGGQVSIVGPTSAKMDISIDPATALGPKGVEVSRNGDPSILSGGIVVTDPAPANVSVFPASGPVNGGTFVTVSGANFRSGAQVYFAGLAAASVTVVNSGTIQATTPGSSPGFSNVVVVNADGTWGVGTGIFGFVTAPPVVNAIAPLSGPPGTVVLVQGNNFGTLLQNVQVTIAGAAARVISLSNNSLQTIVPYGAASGPVAVTVVGQTAMGPNFAVATVSASTNLAPSFYSFKDASIGAGGTPLIFPNGDDSVSQISLPFTFSLFNDIFAPGEPLSISINGWISLAGATDHAYQNSTLPATTVTQTAGGTGAVPAALIAPFWDDLTLEPGTSFVNVRTAGTAPNRQLIVEWTKASIVNDSGIDQNASVTFEAVLFEGSNDIQFMYGDMSGPLSDGSSATVGMQNLSRTTAVLGSFNQGVVKPHSLTIFHYQSGSYTVVAGTTDSTPPGTPVVSDEGRLTSNQKQLAASWTSTAPPSGISSYQYAIGTTPGGADVLPLTSTTNNSAVVSSLNLQTNTTYYFAVQAVSGAGVVSSAGVSAGIRYDPNFQPQIKIIPSAPQSGSEFSGIALLAPQSGSISVVLRGFDSTGQYILGPGILNPITVSLGAGQQSARLISELFGLQSFDGWIQVEGSSSGLGVFTATGADDLSSMDGSNARATSTDFVFFHAGATAILVNPSPRTATLQITDLSTGAVQTSTIAPMNRLVTTIADPSRVRSSEALAAIEEVSSAGKLTINPAEPASGAQASLVFPHAVSGGGYSSTLTLANVSTAAQNATIAFAGVSSSVNIGPNGVLRFPIPTNGTDAVRVNVLPSFFGSSQPVLVGVLDIDNGADPVTIGAPQAASDFWFPQVANGVGLFTGLAMANGQTAANLTVEVYGPGGGTPQSGTLTLSPNQQVARLLTQLVTGVATHVGGYIHVHSDQPVWAWEIYGSDRVQASGPPL